MCAHSTSVQVTALTICLLACHHTWLLTCISSQDLRLWGDSSIGADAHPEHVNRLEVFSKAFIWRRPPQSLVQRELSVDQCSEPGRTEGGGSKNRRERPPLSLFHDTEDLDPLGFQAKLKQPASHWFCRWQGPYITSQPGNVEERAGRVRRRANGCNREAKNTFWKENDHQNDRRRKGIRGG